MARWHIGLSTTSLSVIGAISLACGPLTPEADAAPDLFALAVNGASGGALLGVWGDPAEQRVWLVGGYVGVDPAAVGDGRVGRLVQYSNGAFVTRCTTDRVLWAVHGVREAGATTVWAVGDGGKVIRLRDGRCEEIPLGLSFSDGAPTLRGLWLRAPDDLWIVGGSQPPSAPQGVILHGDGATFTRVATIAPEAREQTFYEITQTGRSLVVVGAGNTLLRSDLTGDFRAETLPPRGGDNRLFSASCLGSICFAVGGSASGFVLSRGLQNGPSPAWSTFQEGLPGLNAVSVQDASNVFMVGADGVTVHTDGTSVFRPTRALTSAPLYGVGGIGARLVLAVGGDVTVTDGAQRAVVLVRDLSRDPALPYTFDGQRFTSQGELRRSLGAGAR